MTVRIEQQDHVTTVIIDRIDARNAVDHATADLLTDAFLAFDADPDARVAVFWGAGGTFCAGYDLKYAASLADPETFRHEFTARLDFPSTGVIPRGPMGPSRLALSKPVIAAVEGASVAGGMELALWCDMRVMAEDAYFGVYCRRWGIPLIDGGTVRLPRLVGAGRAMDIILTGRKVPAEEALRIGLAERLVPHGSARAAAEDLAREIARFPQAAVRADRRSAYESFGLGIREALAQEWAGGIDAFMLEGAAGATRFAQGRGRQGNFQDI
jgi:enoyl-CoA hydratase